MSLDLTDTTVVFDLDGTLIDTAPDLAAATNHVLGLLGLSPIGVTRLHPFIGHGSKAMIEAGLRLHDQFLAFYAANVAVGSRPFEEVPTLLDKLLLAGARLAVCTNKVEHLSKLLLAPAAIQTAAAVSARASVPPPRRRSPAHDFPGRYEPWHLA